MRALYFVIRRTFVQARPQDLCASPPFGGEGKDRRTFVPAMYRRRIVMDVFKNSVFVLLFGLVIILLFDLLLAFTLVFFSLVDGRRDRVYS